MSTALLSIRAVREDEIELVLAFIRELAEYEHLAHEVTATPENIRAALFGSRPHAEAVLGCIEGEPCGFALFFHNFSTFVGKPGADPVTPVRAACRTRTRPGQLHAGVAGEAGAGTWLWSVRMVGTGLERAGAAGVSRTRRPGGG
jgi:hypothetical protein